MDFGRILTEKEAERANGLVLAYVGDAVQSLYVRHRLAVSCDLKAGDLHKLASNRVNAHTQANAADRLFDGLTDREKDVFLRARNSKSHHKAKNQTGADYRKATGLEAVFGYLYLTGDVERLVALLGEAYED
ncbi:MAG: ribonuclease III [Corallococcus sp.]|nr:Mini-ribonuclease 3 [Bacillota bacterium]MCM1533834.1 ribonuclease III [Corallococcus sp.]